MTDKLDDIFERQASAQAKVYGIVPGELEGEPSMDYIRTMTLAASDELHEALAETGWKPWAAGNHLHRGRFGAELVDVLHFVVNLFLAAGWTSDDVHSAFIDKQALNRRRQEEGYTGLAKCRTCKRAFDDNGVECDETACRA